MSDSTGEAASWDVYPRPQLKRNSFFSLNGTWSVTVGRDEAQDIQVPFCIESALSGVKKHVSTGLSVCYRKSFRLPEGFRKERVLLHFGAVDQIARVVVNDHFYGSHEGGYTAFSFDITDSVRAGKENELLVFVEDYLDLHVQPWGKQKEKRGGMWYTPVTGIWQSVWLESVPELYIRDLAIQTREDRVSIDFSASGAPENIRKLLNGRLQLQDGLQKVTVPIREGHAEFIVQEPHFWTPEDPFLYHFEVSIAEDQFSSYFALRDISVGECSGIPRLLLNGKPYFFHGVLDQGYFQDGIYTPETPEAYSKDLQLLKDCGFNMLRKHIKVEPEIFYYYCDSMGIAVFQDMVNCGSYHYVRDTVLPTIGVGKNRRDRHLNRNPRARAAFEKNMEATVRQLQNHPSIVYWTIFNEGWGQFEGFQMYEKLKALDDSRIIDTASGWYHGKDLKTDVESRHVYFKPAKPVKSDRPYILSEFGGYTLEVPGHLFNPQKSYGYKGHASKEALMADLQTLFERDVIAAIPLGLCADIYTQLSDIEDEINGLVTYDRAVVKVEPAVLKALSERIAEAMRDVH